ncbi:MAG: GNAT family N-acetyltransferase [Candidatus Cloacimonetes bacterium]|nr:GNAT family N-acetyltransferase [Candidatus Cloacimonadota bacterium]
MINDFCFAPYRSENYDQLISLWKKAGLPYRGNGRDSRASLNNEIKHNRELFLLVWTDQILAGSILATHDGRRGWINRIAIDPQYRRAGLATDLISRAEQWLESQGIGIYSCLIESWNRSSLKLFDKLGYHKHEDIIYVTKRKYPEI